MRIVTWNCREKLDEKNWVLEGLSADVWAIQEATPDASFAAQPGMTSIYGAPYPSARKGTLVIARAPWEVVARPVIDGQPWVLPAEVRNSTTGETLSLYALWTNTGVKDGRPGYAGQFTRFLEFLQKRGPLEKTVVLGDLNAPVPGTSDKPHAKNVGMATDLGLVSLYHHANGVAHGKDGNEEPDKTLRWVGAGGVVKFFHCDFIFATRDLLHGATCHVEPTFEHNDPPSDHQAVVATMKEIQSVK